MEMSNSLQIEDYLNLMLKLSKILGLPFEGNICRDIFEESQKVDIGDVKKSTENISNKIISKHFDNDPKAKNFITSILPMLISILENIKN